jgi:hypothetical protein
LAGLYRFACKNDERLRLVCSGLLVVGWFYLVVCILNTLLVIGVL